MTFGGGTRPGNFFPILAQIREFSHITVIFMVNIGISALKAPFLENFGIFKEKEN